jgi:hypothetical protein
MTKEMTREEIKARFEGATTSQELYERSVELSDELGLRLPTIVEVVKGYAMVLTEVFGDKDAKLLTKLAARATKVVMEQTDSEDEAADSEAQSF